MRRRGLLKSVAAITAGAGLVWAHTANGLSNGSLLTPAGKKPQAKQFIEAADGTSLYHKEWGSGRPVLFLHSWGLHSDLWQYQMIYLADRGIRCIAYDRRGHGRSSDPGHGYEIDTLADDLSAVIESLDLKEVTLVGHSLGCGEIVRYLSRHGSGRTARVVLVAPTLPFMTKTTDNPEGVDRALWDGLRARAMSDFPQVLAETVRPTGETTQPTYEWTFRMFEQASLKALLECNRVGQQTDYRSELPKITVPTLIVHGDKDLSAPLEWTGRKTAAMIPGSRLVVYEGAPHGLMLTHVSRLNADLLAFAKG
jgi:non-heme chloroperoxidase